MRSTEPIAAGQSGALVAVTPRRAGWDYVGFAVRRIAAARPGRGRTGGNEVCLVLLAGLASISWSPAVDRTRVQPRPAPRRVHRLPARASTCRRGRAFEVTRSAAPEIAECRSPTAKRFPARVIRPEDCGLEVRGGGNATRQIIDILPPAAAADRLLVCEVLTPAGNWSSYPPHKHDRHAPPVEADLEETYYYRFSGRGRLRHPAALHRRRPRRQVLRVAHGDLVLVRDGYHPFVARPASMPTT